MGGRGSSSSMGGGMGGGGAAGIAATQQHPQNAPPFAVPQGIKINAGNIITPAAVQQQQPPQPQQPPIAQAPHADKYAGSARCAVHTDENERRPAYRAAETG